MDTVMDTSKKHPHEGLNWLLLELEKYMCLSFLLKKCKKRKKGHQGQCRFNVDTYRFRDSLW